MLPALAQQRGAGGKQLELEGYALSDGNFGTAA